MIFDSKYERAMEWLKKQDNGHGKRNVEQDNIVGKEELPDMETIRAEALMDYEEEELKPGAKDVLALVLSAFGMILPVALVIFAMVYLVAWLMFLC